MERPLTIVGNLEWSFLMYCDKISVILLIKKRQNRSDIEIEACTVQKKKKKSRHVGRAFPWRSINQQSKRVLPQHRNFSIYIILSLHDIYLFIKNMKLAKTILNWSKSWFNFEQHLIKMFFPFLYEDWLEEYNMNKI